jgi:hypothetical protein
MSDFTTRLHIRLDERSLKDLKHRANERHMPLPAYTARILRYLALLDVPPPSNPPSLHDTPELYVTTSLPAHLRSRLITLSERCQCSLASFAGIWISGFLERFTQDPADLDMLCHLGELLERRSLLSETDLEAIVRLATATSVSRMPAPYQVRWYHARLRPLLPMIEWRGQARPFTPEQVAAILTRINP